LNDWYLASYAAFFNSLLRAHQWEWRQQDDVVRQIFLTRHFEL
jgi:hypothetical protein